MFRKGIVFAALCLLPAIANAQATRGPWELTLNGAAANGPKFNGVSASANAGVGYYFNDSIEIGLRQSVAFSDIAGVGLDASTRAAIDLHLPLGDQGQFVPYIGLNVGYVYGKAVHSTWEGAPEAGLKWYVNATTFIYGSIEYQFFFDKNKTAGAALSDGQFIYGLGIGFRF